jgi:hypothetical protein
MAIPTFRRDEYVEIDPMEWLRMTKETDITCFVASFYFHG